MKIQQQQYACDDPMIEHMCNQTTVLYSLWCQICNMVIIFQFCGFQSLANFPKILALKKKLLFSKKSQNFSNFCCCHNVKICQRKHTLIIALMFVRFCHITDWTKEQTCTQLPLLYFQVGLVCKRTQQLSLLPVNLC